MSVYVGRWDCPTCGTKAIAGPETRCPNCGSSRPKNVRFYLPEDAEMVDDEARIKEARAGADWICGHCGTQNKAADTACKACGNERDESSQDVALSEREYGLDELPTGSFAPKRSVHPLEEQQKRPKKRRAGIRFILLIGLVLFGGWMLLKSFPKTVEVTVSSFEWKRSFQLEHYETVGKEAWSVPNGAFDVSSFRAIKSYKQVLRGYETKTRTKRVQVGTERYVCGKVDKGNGYFVDKYCTRAVYENRQETYEEPVYDQVPVYATKYKFKVKEWVSRKSNLLTSSGKNQEAKWPTDVRLNSPKEWRSGQKKGNYYLTVKEDNGTAHREEVSYDYWQKLKKGQRIKAKKAYVIGTWYGLERK